MTKMRGGIGRGRGEGGVERREVPNKGGEQVEGRGEGLGDGQKRPKEEGEGLEKEEETPKEGGDEVYLAKVLAVSLAA